MTSPIPQLTELEYNKLFRYVQKSIMTHCVKARKYFMDNKKSNLIGIEMEEFLLYLVKNNTTGYLLDDLDFIRLAPIIKLSKANTINEYCHYTNFQFIKHVVNYLPDDLDARDILKTHRRKIFRYELLNNPDGLLVALINHKKSRDKLHDLFDHAISKFFRYGPDLKVKMSDLTDTVYDFRRLPKGNINKTILLKYLESKKGIRQVNHNNLRLLHGIGRKYTKKNLTKK